MEKFGRLPVLLNGRIKPLDTVARNSLLIIHGKQTLAAEGGSLTPMDWLAEVMMKPEQADERRIFVIRNADTLAALGWKPDAEKYFSFREFVPHLQDIEQKAALAQKVDAQLRSPFQRDIIKLFERLTLYHRLANSLEVKGTGRFQKPNRRPRKKHSPLACADEQRNHGGSPAEPRFSGRDRLFSPDPSVPA